MTNIEDIASVHLGKAGDGSVVKPYVTPDSVDPSLLVGVPRVLNRTAYEIDEENLPFEGRDMWNCYEFSTLTDNGFPVSGLLRVAYPSNSTCIVESKSLKLYLNSFNMMKNGPTINDVRMNVEARVYEDLVPVLGTEWIDIGLHFEDSTERKPVDGDFTLIERYVDPTKVSFEHFNESPDILVVEDCDKYPKRWRSSVLRSNCRVTNQPDWGDVFIHIKGNKTVTPESLLQYIVSMRKENHFHEEICECIYKRLHDLLNPEELVVVCLYTRRGGIDINPVRATSEDLLWDTCSGLLDAYSINTKTQRQ
ncbi:NADPH-dependent 7-cyano-7-deazaguanine reductase QueF [bacterium]|nr:NADPH-dependent 7-cyano-7-deazaguanine reductase QueF [bacterium]